MSTIACKICGAEIHHVGAHLKESHPDWTAERYRAEFPDAEMVSAVALQLIKDAQAARAAKATSQVNMESSANVLPFNRERRVPMHELFGLGDSSLAKDAHGDPIMQLVLADGESKDMVPDIDSSYVYDIELLKQINLGLEVNIPMLIWGYHGCGKTTILQQVCARTNRPTYRVQHTLNMIESDVVGGWRAKDGNTYFDLGPLPLAMIHGWVYIADEYDRAPPGVTSLYQAVLEGEPLVIKEAPPESRVIRPHPNFRFCATGNTNGAGDDSGLYSGTMIGDAANYSRFGITERIRYLPAKAEAALLQAKCQIPKEWADDLARFAGLVREGFDEGKVSTTIGPRELIYAGMIGVRRYNIKLGVESAILNRWSSVDRVVGEELMQRIWG